MAEQETDRIVRAYLEILENGEEGPHFAPESWLPENRELISEALLSVLIRLPGHSDWERWRAGFIELERYLNEEDWGLVEEFSNRAEEGPEAILAMDKERMQAANGVTRAVSQRKIARMEKLNESRHAGEHGTRKVISMRLSRQPRGPAEGGGTCGSGP